MNAHGYDYPTSGELAAEAYEDERHARDGRMRCGFYLFGPRDDREIVFIDDDASGLWHVYRHREEPLAFVAAALPTMERVKQPEALVVAMRVLLAARAKGAVSDDDVDAVLGAIQ